MIVKSLCDKLAFIQVRDIFSEKTKSDFRKNIL